MKKIMFAAAIVCAVVVAQAASIKWSSDVVNGVDTTKLNGNGDYSAAGGVLKGNSALTYVLTFFEEGTDTVAGSLSGSVPFVTGNVISKSGNLTGLSLNTTYDYVLEITGTQNDLTGVIGDWDYSDATITYKDSGKFTTNKSGQSPFSNTPGAWTVAGAVPVQDVPEPTSGLLIALGMAGLALRRKQK